MKIWFTDKKCQTQQFANDQAANGRVCCCLLSIFDIILAATSSRGNRWSLITMGHIHYSYIRDIFALSPCAVGFALCNVCDIYILQMALGVFGVIVAR